MEKNKKIQREGGKARAARASEERLTNQVRISARQRCTQVLARQGTPNQRARVCCRNRPVSTSRALAKFVCVGGGWGGAVSAIGVSARHVLCVGASMGDFDIDIETLMSAVGDTGVQLPAGSLGSSTNSWLRPIREHQVNTMQRYLTQEPGPVSGAFDLDLLAGIAPGSSDSLQPGLEVDTYFQQQQRYKVDGTTYHHVAHARPVVRNLEDLKLDTSYDLLENDTRKSKQEGGVERIKLEADQTYERAKAGLEELRRAQSRGELSRWQEVNNPNVLSGDNSSLDVFLSFCKYYRDGSEGGDGFLVVDASGMFSRNCYEAWLSTRQRALKKPEESYRKTLTAHTQGSDGRKPFPIEVERAVLVDLRKQKVWACYEGRLSSSGEKMSIGLQGFRGMGYHEKKSMPSYLLPTKQKKKRSPAAASASSGAGAAGSLEQGKRNREDMESGGGTRVVLVPIQDRVDENLKTWKQVPKLITICARKLGVRAEELFDNVPSLQDVFEESSVENNKILCVLGPSANPRTVRAAALVVWTRFFKPTQFFSLLGMSTIYKPDLFDNKFMALDLSVRDDRIDPNFMLPGKEGWEWYDLEPELPCLRNVFDMDTCMYIDQDEISQRYMGNMKGSFAPNLLHPFQFWMTIIQIIPHVMSKGQVVWQTQAINQRGKTMVSRTRYTIHGNHIKTCFQDVTHLYPDIMALPPLEEVFDEQNKKLRSSGESIKASSN